MDIKPLESPVLSDEELAEIDSASNHPYHCTCFLCLKWWRSMGPDDDGSYGPFGEELP